METQTENQSLRRYIVTLKKGVDYDSFYHDMETVTDNIPHIPNRAVAIPTWLPHSSRNTYYLLSEFEAIELKGDPRVLDVAIPVEDDDRIIVGHQTIQTSNFNRPASGSVGGQGSYKNWGLLRSAFRSNIYGSSISPSASGYPYHLDGTGVDYVVCDTGIELAHPEFQDANGVSRIQEISWPDQASLGLYPQHAAFYSDFQGHGTHVASTSVGKTFGWAKNARIYSMKIKLGGMVASEGAYESAQCLAFIREWHKNKPTDTVTGVKRPTVVNCSWGFAGFSGNGFTGAANELILSAYKYVTKGVYQGTTWYGPGWPGPEATTYDAAKMYADYGANFGRMFTTTTGVTTGVISGIPSRGTGLDAEMEDLIDAGIHVCLSMGNSNSYCTNDPNDVNYNNYVELPMYVFPYYADDMGSVQEIAEGATVVQQNARAGMDGTLTFLDWTTTLSVGDTVLINPALPDKVTLYRITKINSRFEIEISPGYKTYNRTWDSALSDKRLRRPERVYTHRGSSPYADGAIKVSAVDSGTKLVSGFVMEQSANYSNKGPMTTVWAPGTNITAAWPTGAASTAAAATALPAYAYNENANYKQRCIGGTSMASPQVAGVVALYLQLNPSATTSEVKQFIVNSSIKNQLYDTNSTDYINRNSIWNSPNRFLYFPYANDNGLGADVTLTGEGGQANNLKIAPISYTYANWASDYKLSNTEKLLGINIANFFYLSKEKLGLQYTRFSFAFERMSGTITSTAARTTITGISSARYNDLTPGMVITRNSGGGAFGAGTTTVVSVDGGGQITIQSGAANTVGSINFDTPILVQYDVYGLNRKPDTAGLEYWTRRCLKTNPAYVDPGDTWTAGDYTSTAFKKAFCDAVFLSSGGVDRENFFGPLRYQGGYWTNGDFSDKGIKP